MQTSEPHAVDLHVGAMIRQRRKQLGKSQMELADALGLTFQQIQKYEKGTNRISASKLYGMTKFLNVSIGFFFETLNEEDAAADMAPCDAEYGVTQFLATIEGLELACSFPKIEKPRLRRRLLELVKALASD